MLQAAMQKSDVAHLSGDQNCVSLWASSLRGGGGGGPEDESAADTSLDANRAWRNVPRADVGHLPRPGDQYDTDGYGHWQSAAVGGAEEQEEEVPHTALDEQIGLPAMHAPDTGPQVFGSPAGPGHASALDRHR